VDDEEFASDNDKKAYLDGDYVDIDMDCIEDPMFDIGDNVEIINTCIQRYNKYVGTVVTIKERFLNEDGEWVYYLINTDGVWDESELEACESDDDPTDPYAGDKPQAEFKVGDIVEILSSDNGYTKKFVGSSYSVKDLKYFNPKGWAYQLNIPSYEYYWWTEGRLKKALELVAKYHIGDTVSIRYVNVASNEKYVNKMYKVDDERYKDCQWNYKLNIPEKKDAWWTQDQLELIDTAAASYKYEVGQEVIVGSHTAKIATRGINTGKQIVYTLEGQRGVFFESGLKPVEPDMLPPSKFKKDDIVAIVGAVGLKKYIGGIYTVLESSYLHNGSKWVYCLNIPGHEAVWWNENYLIKYTTDSSEPTKAKVNFDFTDHYIKEDIMNTTEMYKTRNSNNEGIGVNMFNLKFGKIENDKVKASMFGAAYKCHDGKYYAYKDGEAVDVTEFVIADQVFAIPTTTVAVDDIILKGDYPLVVRAIKANGELEVYNPGTGNVEIYLSPKHAFGFKFYTKVISILGSVLNGGAVGDEKSLMMMAMMGGFGGAAGKMNMNSLLPLMLMKDGGIDGMDNPLMIMVMMGGLNGSGGADMSNMLPILLMGDMFKKKTPTKAVAASKK
jgi:hypothetical protein